MVLLWKAVVLEVGVKGVQAHSQKMWFAENLGNITENSRKNGAQHCLTSKNGAQCLHKNTWRLFWRSHLCGREFVDKICTKNFSGEFGEIRAKILRSPQNLPAPKPMMERPLRPIAPLLKGQRDECPRHASTFRRPCAHYSTRIPFTRCCRLQFVTVINIISGILRQQFINAKNALKQGCRTHSVACYVSAVHNCKNTKLGKCLVEQQRSEGMQLGLRTPRVDSLKLLNCRIYSSISRTSIFDLIKRYKIF